MNSQDAASEIEILKWAASSSDEMPNPRAVNEDRLLGLLWQHRLAMRLQERIRGQRPPWWTRRLAFAVLGQCRHARQDLRRRLEVTAEVAAALPATGKPLMTIKGASTYALTGDERNIRHSADVDLMFHDMPLLHGTLTQLGFAGEPWKWAAHEYGAMTRGDFQIEPHLYFPVFAYPPERPPDLIPTRNPGYWVQNTSNGLRHKIAYEDLLPHCQPGSSPETSHLWVPNPSMAALILCAHEFREFLQRPCRYAIIQLSTLADICDLVGHKQFDPALFLSLIHEFDGGDSVHLVQSLMRAYFGIDAFPFLPADMSPPGGCYAFPKFLTYYGVWAQMDDDPDDFLLPLPTERAFRRLQPNLIDAAASAIPKSYGGLTAGTEDALSRIIVQTTKDTPFPSEAGLPFEVSAAWRPNGLGLRITLQGPLEEGFNYHLKLYSSEGINVYHNVSLLPPDPLAGDMLRECRLEQFAQENVSGRLDGTKCHIQFFLPWNELPRMQPENASLPVMLVITRWRQEEEDIYENADPVIAAPLQITKA